MKEQLTDESLMPFGQHQGKRLIDVPASYLLWLYREKLETLSADMKWYIEDNLQVLEFEVKRNHETFNYEDV